MYCILHHINTYGNGKWVHRIILIFLTCSSCCGICCSFPKLANSQGRQHRSKVFGSQHPSTPWNNDISCDWYIPFNISSLHFYTYHISATLPLPSAPFSLFKTFHSPSIHQIASDFPPHPTHLFLFSQLTPSCWQDHQRCFMPLLSIFWDL